MSNIPDNGNNDATPANPPPFPSPGEKAQLEEGDLFTPRFNADGLIGAIVTDAATGTVLMFAYMNADALALTMKTRQAHFYSRSRNRLWRKGEESGNVLQVASIRTDCDQDALWLTVTIAGEGAACHTGRHSCFYREVRCDDQGRPRLAHVSARCPSARALPRA